MFGCELTLLTVDTLRPLNDPIHDELWDNEGFDLVLQKCFWEVCSKEQIKREVYEDHPKAIWVQLMNQVFSLPKLFSPLLAFGMRK